MAQHENQSIDEHRVEVEFEPDDDDDVGMNDSRLSTETAQSGQANNSITSSNDFAVLCFSEMFHGRWGAAAPPTAGGGS